MTFMLQNLPATCKWASIAASKLRLHFPVYWDQKKDTQLLIFQKKKKIQHSLSVNIVGVQVEMCILWIPIYSMKYIY